MNRRTFLKGALAGLAGALLPNVALAAGPQVGPLIEPRPEVGLRAQAYGRPSWFPQGFWKAVYVVGDIDNYGPGTAQHIATGKEIASGLRELGLEVAEFYPPDNHWEDIKAAARDAHLFIYNGHGVYYWDGDPNKVGGFCLRPDEFVRPERIATELKLPAGASAQIFACFAAGSPGGETYCPPEKAYDRVVQYATPFLEAGAHGYYALWDPGYPLRCASRLQEGARFTDPYWESSFFQSGHADAYLHPTISGVRMYLGWDGDGANKRTYTTTFVGYEQERFRDTFGPIAATLWPPSALLSLPARTSKTVSFTVRAESDLDLSWHVSVEEGQNWAAVEQTEVPPEGEVKLHLQPPRGGTHRAVLSVRSDDPRTVAASAAIEADAWEATFLPLVSS